MKPYIQLTAKIYLDIGNYFSISEEIKQHISELRKLLDINYSQVDIMGSIIYGKE